jgi:hypothetical protein
MEVFNNNDLRIAIKWVFDYCQKGTEPKTVEEAKSLIEDWWDKKINDISPIQEYFEDKELFEEYIIEKENYESSRYY